MNGTLLGLLIPTVADEFSVSTELAAWISIGSQFTSAMLGDSIGMLADSIGRTFTWRLFGALGVISQPLCGFAPNIWVLIAARAFGGMTWAGGGPAGFAIMAEGLEPAKRGIVSAWQTMSGTFGGSMGTVAGGFVIAVMGWRWVFLFAMGPMAAMWLLSLCVLPEDHQVKTRGDLKAKVKAFDKAGTLLFIAFSGCFLMGLNRGNDLGWDSNVVVGFFIAALALLPVLIAVERRAPEPILPFSLIFADSTAMKCLLLGAGSQTTHTGSYNILPIFMQLAQGWSPYEAGLVLFCRPLGGFLCSLVISRLMRRDAVPLVHQARLALAVLRVPHAVFPGASGRAWQPGAAAAADHVGANHAGRRQLGLQHPRAGDPGGAYAGEPPRVNTEVRSLNSRWLGKSLTRVPACSCAAR